VKGEPSGPLSTRDKRAGESIYYEKERKEEAKTYEGRGPDIICPGLISKYVV
jgi:hypothetical protein